MGESSTVLQKTIKKKGHWNFTELYNYIKGWCKEHGLKIIENEYVEKGTGPKEIAIDWTIKKKVTDYFRNKITIKWDIQDLTDEEAERDGKKIKTNKGDLKLSFRAELEGDYEGRWEDKPFNKFIRGIYDKYIMRTTQDEYEDRLADLTSDMIDDVKAYLELSS